MMVNPNQIIAPTQWIKKNMLGVYSEELGRPLTEAEIRVQRCLEQLQVPDWYIKYSRPTRILKSDVPIERRPPTWRMYSKTASLKKKRGQSSPKTPRKSQQLQCTSAEPVEKSPKKSVQVNVSPVRSMNSSYRIIRRAMNQTKKPSISISSSSSDSETDSQEITTTASISPSPPNSDIDSRNETGTVSVVSSVDDESDSASNSAEEPQDVNCTPRPSLNSSNTFPRMAPSRKVQNINIVLPKDFTPKPPKKMFEAPDNLESSPVASSPASSPAKQTVFTLTKSFRVLPEDDTGVDDSAVANSLDVNKSHVSFLFAEIEPNGVKNAVQVFAGVDSDPDDEERLGAESLHARFFNSYEKSRELERIVQSERTIQSGQLIQEIIGELDRSIAESRINGTRNDESYISGESGSFVRSMVQALEEHSYKLEEGEDEDEDEDEDEVEDEVENDVEDDVEDDADSELAKSTSISFEEDDRTVSPLSYVDEPQQEDVEDKEEEIYWIPNKMMFDLPRTSSRLSVHSRQSNNSGFQCASGRSSPGLSPIKSIDNKHWTLTVSSCASKTPRQLFRIDETNIDSGYGGKSGSSRTPTPSSDARSSPLSSMTPSPMLREFPDLGITNDMLFKLPGPVTTKSVFV